MDNMNMENVENMEHSNKNNRKESCLKYLTIFLGTIVGAFLAFYFVADYTVKSLLNPEHQIRRAEKMMKKMDKEIAREFDKNMSFVEKSVQVPISIEQKNNSYIVRFSLKSFGNTSKNIKVSVEDDNILIIEGFNEVKKNNSENMMKMLQSYRLQNKVDSDRMTTKEEKGEYIITLPFER